jgi:ABC-type nitrate/sulfonate/bicarbonate transport system ATPase subunit
VQHQFSVLLGPSGCGKRPFLGILTGLMTSLARRRAAQRQADREAGPRLRQRVEEPALFSWPTAELTEIMHPLRDRPAQAAA